MRELMIGKLDPEERVLEELQVFQQTSDAPYDRHVYKVNIGDESFIVEDYEHLRALWFQNLRNYDGVTVEVLDVQKNKKKKSKGGFK